MSVIEIVLGVLLIVVSAVIVLFTLLQEHKGRGLSGAIMGDNGNSQGFSSTLSNDAQMMKLTKYAGIAFVVVAIILSVVSARMG